MRKGSFVLSVLLLAFWLVLSEKIDLQHILIGIFIVLITIWFWQDLRLKQPAVLSLSEILDLGRCLVLLIGYIIHSNLVVAKILLFHDKALKPVFIKMDTSVKSNWGRILLATCITLTPGTITIDVDPDTGLFIVHALTEEIGVNLFYWRLIHRIEDLEIQRQRRRNNNVDAGKFNGPNPGSALESSYRPHGH